VSSKDYKTIKIIVLQVELAFERTASIMASATPGCLWIAPQHWSTGGKARAGTPNDAARAHTAEIVDEA
jgi:hypothetical protein